jgi:hypothetical protein
MKSRSVLAEINVDRRQISAHFQPSTGRLVITEGTAIVEAIRPPDSWIALAAVSATSGWGTQPTPANLRAFLEGYVAMHPRFVRTATDQLE